MGDEIKRSWRKIYFKEGGNGGGVTPRGVGGGTDTRIRTLSEFTEINNIFLPILRVSRIRNCDYTLRSDKAERRLTARIDGIHPKETKQ